MNKNDYSPIIGSRCEEEFSELQALTSNESVSVQEYKLLSSSLSTS